MCPVSAAAAAAAFSPSRTGCVCQALAGALAAQGAAMQAAPCAVHLQAWVGAASHHAAVACGAGPAVAGGLGRQNHVQLAVC
jgi:hypothetical protein